MLTLILRTSLLLVLFAPSATAGPIRWSAADGANDLYYRLAGTRGNSSLLGGSMSADSEAFLAMSEYLDMITVRGDGDFLIEIAATASGEALLKPLVERRTGSRRETPPGEANRGQQPRRIAR